MTTSVLESLQVLSAAPWFDDSAGVELIGLGAKGKLESQQEAVSALERVRRCGVLVSRNGFHRVSEPLRSELRRSLFARNEELYVAALRVFASHAENGMSASLDAVMGSRG